jgi:hypothetical protein
MRLTTDDISSRRMAARRFPPPWSVEETAACFIVCDSNGQKIGLCLFRG